MPGLADRLLGHLAVAPEIGRSAWRTWGAKGLVRRAGYEATRRSGRLTAAEERWLARRGPIPTLRSAGVTVPAGVVVGDVPGGIVLYGGLALDASIPPAWHAHPITGHRYPDDVHWSALSDADPIAGDIKDVWDLSRFGWLLPRLRQWAATGDDAVAEGIWRVIEDWVAANPPYRGVHWMCGQETSLRTMTTMFLADALRDSPTTTPARRELVGSMVVDAVGRVAPTMAYALSQRNNHAISEAGFLWSAAVLAPELADADRLRRRAARALTEAVEDQFAADGSYSQHAPTYQRVAMQVLLWCLAVSRSTGTAVPAGVPEAVARGAGHLRSLLVPGGDGVVPNLGSNDGAHVLPLTGQPIGDFRPLLVHARAAIDGTTDLPAGPWDEEAAWFGLTARRSASPTLVPGSVTRALTVGTSHVVFRAGPLRHRPAHADQLHVDVWFDGRPVAVDAGSYRYTAPAPWANALAGEEVHNLPRIEGVPQAVRSGRFFWRRWAEAEVVPGAPTDVARTARLELPDGSVLVRAVRVEQGRAVVVDRIEGAAEGVVRWNLASPVTAEPSAVGTDLRSDRWAVRMAHPGDATARTSVDDDPTSGWVSPTYATRVPVAAVEVPLVPGRATVTVFVDGSALDGATPEVDDAFLEDLVGR